MSTSSMQHYSYLMLRSMLLSVLLCGCAVQHTLELPEPLASSAIDKAINVLPSALLIDNKHNIVERLPALNVGETPNIVSIDGLTLSKGDFMLNADGMSLNRFIHFSLGEVLGLSFFLDPALAERKDPVTLHVSEKVNALRLLSIIEQTLSSYDIGLKWNGQEVSVMPSSKLKNLPPALIKDPSAITPTSGRILTVVPLKYAGLSELMRFVKYFLQVNKGGAIEANTRLNALIIIGTPARTKQLMALIAMLDKPLFANLSLSLLKPVYWQADELLPVLSDALSSQGFQIAKRPDQKGIYLRAIDNINAIMIAAPDDVSNSWLNTWLQQIDTPNAVGGAQQSFIYFVRNSSAVNLGELLSQVLGGQSLSPDSTQKTGSTSGQNRAAASSVLGVGLRVVVDSTRNALIFIGSPQAYKTAYSLLRQLDIPAKQVLIEATIADVSIDKSRQLGVEWRHVGSDSITSTLGGLGVGSGGLSYTLFDDLGLVRAKLSALASSGDARILSSPKLLAIDNEEARMQVGTQVAVLTQEIANTSSATATETGLLRNFEYIDTGVILRFTPTVMADGAVRMEIYQEVSAPGASNNNTPPISKRTIETTLVAESGQTIMLGGLITQNSSQQVTSVPLLGKIPIIGNLFRSKQDVDSSTEMIILITPHIIDNRSTADQLKAAFQHRLDF